jgi:hypothetical protein
MRVRDIVVGILILFNLFVLWSICNWRKSVNKTLNLLYQEVIMKEREEVR